MKCPQCGREMQPGYISAGGYRVIWTPQERKMMAIPGKDGEVIARLTFSGKGTPADICKACHKVVIDYGWV